jgi:hypothetical protein
MRKAEKVECLGLPFSAPPDSGDRVEEGKVAIAGLDARDECVVRHGLFSSQKRERFLFECRKKTAKRATAPQLSSRDAGTKYRAVTLPTDSTQPLSRTSNLNP